MWRYVKKVFAQYYELISYLIVGGLTTVVSLGSYYILVVTIFNPSNPFQLQAANILSWIVAVLFAYFTNRKFVFRSSNSELIKEFMTFIIARLGSLAIDMGCMFLLVTIWGLYDKTAKMLVQIVIVVINYLLSKLLIFRKR